MADVEQPRTGARFRRPLTRAELARVLAPLAASTGHEPPARSLVALWDVILADAEGTTYAVAHASNLGLRPNDYAIPSHQADEILQAMMDGRRARVRASIRLAWLDKGPATYDDEAGPG